MDSDAIQEGDSLSEWDFMTEQEEEAMGIFRGLMTAAIAGDDFAFESYNLTPQGAFRVLEVALGMTCALVGQAAADVGTTPPEYWRRICQVWEEDISDG